MTKELLEKVEIGDIISDEEYGYKDKYLKTAIVVDKTPNYIITVEHANYLNNLRRHKVYPITYDTKILFNKSNYVDYCASTPVEFYKDKYIEYGGKKSKIFSIEKSANEELLPIKTLQLVNHIKTSQYEDLYAIDEWMIPCLGITIVDADVRFTDVKHIKDMRENGIYESKYLLLSINYETGVPYAMITKKFHKELKKLVRPIKLDDLYRYFQPDEDFGTPRKGLYALEVILNNSGSYESSKNAYEILHCDNDYVTMKSSFTPTKKYPEYITINRQEFDLKYIVAK